MSNTEPLDADDLELRRQSIEEQRLLRAALEGRCIAANIPIEDVEPWEDDELACRIGIPCGRDRRWVFCYNFNDYQELLDIPFEKYVFLTGFDAIFCYETSEVEANVSPITAPFNPRLLNSRLFGIPLAEASFRELTGSITVQSTTNTIQTTLVLGRQSSAISVLSQTRSRSRLSLKINRNGLTEHDLALEVLQKTSDALFFQIDLISDVPLTLMRDRRSTPLRKLRRRQNELPAVTFPTHEYDAAPVSLYWYARSAVDMPLLQFLAFYQVVEYYYPTYSQAEARRRLKAILKDPAFRSDRDADLVRLLSAIHVTRSGSLGDEKSQLKATVLECVDADELRAFLVADSARLEFLSSKTKGLTDHKLPIANPTIDLRSDVADRIYDIRCKIVHTKTDNRSGEVDLLLPFSKEAEQLFFDIELMQYVARNVLIAASTPFQLA